MLFSAVLAFLVTSVATPLVICGLRRWNVLDVPNVRSSHENPTPRGGGLAVATGVIVATLVAPELDGTARWALLVAGVGCGAVGLLDDLVGVPALRRLPLLFVGAAACLPWLLSGLEGTAAWRVAFAIAVVVWIVGYVNAFNFMDGINGVAAGQVVVAGVTWFVIGQAQDLGWLSTIGLILAAAALAFLPYNLPAARVFLGDVGSYFLGAALAAAAVGAVRAGLPPEAVLAPLGVFLADTAVTLVQRVVRGERWYEAHRQHAYQRLTTFLGESHTKATGVVVMVMGACAAMGSLSLLDSVALRLAGDLALAALLAGYLAAPSMLARARRGDPAFA